MCYYYVAVNVQVHTALRRMAREPQSTKFVHLTYHVRPLRRSHIHTLHQTSNSRRLDRIKLCSRPGDVGGKKLTKPSCRAPNATTLIIESTKRTSPDTLFVAHSTYRFPNPPRHIHERTNVAVENSSALRVARVMWPFAKGALKCTVPA